jgi:acetyl esterase
MPENAPRGVRLSLIMQHIRRTARGGTALGAVIIAALIGSVLAGCAPSADANQVRPASVEIALPIYPDATVTPDIPYGSRDGEPLLLDVCQPADATTSALNNGPRRAIISVHGGSWRQGDKGDPWWRSTCEWLASEGFVAFSVNYSLAPAAPFPAGIDDVRAAVRWLREPAQIAQYSYDPALIGAFGGSAGGNLVALLGTSGTGAWDAASRVAAVVDLSGPIDLTAAGLKLGAPHAEFAQVQLDYLGCASYEPCLAAASASPHRHLDASDPPMFIGHSSEEFVPVEQSTMLADAARDAGVPVTYLEIPGTAHSIGMLIEPTHGDSVRAAVVRFLRDALAG